MTKKLNTAKLNLLLKVLEKNVDEKVYSGLKNNNFFDLEESNIKTILAILSEEFSENGFDKISDEPNEYGLRIDELISFFSELNISKR